MIFLSSLNLNNFCIAWLNLPPPSIKGIRAKFFCRYIRFRVSLTWQVLQASNKNLLANFSGHFSTSKFGISPFTLNECKVCLFIFAPKIFKFFLLTFSFLFNSFSILPFFHILHGEEMVRTGEQKTFFS